jgi:hypothetical protein
MARFTVPKQTLNSIVDKYHVGTSDDSIRADIRARADRMRAHCLVAGLAQSTDNQVQKMEAYAVQRHHANRELYSRVMSGRF